MDTHELKCWPEYFKSVYSGMKTFEVRKNDRDYKVGDTLHLREWNPNAPYFGVPSGYTGRGVLCQVTYILEGGNFGIETGFVIMGLTKPEYV